VRSPIVVAMTTSVRELSRAECLEQLQRCSVGRVAFTVDALPAVRPVNYAVSGNKVLFRTTPGGTLARACDGAVVAFEVDEIPADGGNAWSVVIVGMAAALEGSAELRAVETGLASAVGGDRRQFLAITIGDITGREVSR
jgi:uncharacterized protein